MSLATAISALATRAAQEIKLRGMPAGGAVGQVITKTAAGDYAAGWGAAATGGGGSNTIPDAYKGDWNSALSYVRGDLVRTTSGLWTALRDSVASTPGQPVVLDVIASQEFSSLNLAGTITAFSDNFTPTTNLTVNAIRVPLSSAAAASDFTIGLSSPIALGTATASTPWLTTALGSPAKQRFVLGAAPTGYAVVAFDSPVQLIAGQQYAVSICTTASAVLPVPRWVSGTSVANGLTIGTTLYGEGNTYSSAFADIPYYAHFPFELLTGSEAWVDIAPAGSNTEFKGAWSSAASYILGDQVVYASAQYKALRGTANENPSAVPATVYVGSWKAAGGDGPFANQAVMKIATPSSGTYPNVRVSHTGPGRVGFSAAKPTTLGVIDWLAYADVTGANPDHLVALNTQLVIASGATEIWAVWNATSGNNINGAASGSTDAGGTSGFAFYGAGYATTMAYKLLIEAAAPPSLAWSKVYDIPRVSTDAGQAITLGSDSLPFLSQASLAYDMSSKYKGEWNSVKAYVPGDLVIRANSVWEASLASTGTDPAVAGATAYTLGGPNAIGGGFSDVGTEEIISPTVGTYTKVKIAVSGPGRAGLSRTKPGSPNTVVWLGYADVAAGTGGAYQEFTLNVPVTVAAGETLWMVWVGVASGNNILAPAAGTPISTLGPAFYATSRSGSFDGTLTGYTLNFQTGIAASSWDKALDAPSVQPTAQTTTLTAASGDGTVVLARGFTLLAVAYSGAGRLRLYRTTAGRTADLARAFTTAYTGGAGLLYDYLATAAVTDIERPVDGAWAAGETTIYTRVDSGPVDITLTWIKTAEA